MLSSGVGGIQSPAAQKVNNQKISTFKIKGDKMKGSEFKVLLMVINFLKNFLRKETLTIREMEHIRETIKTLERKDQRITMLKELKWSIIKGGKK